MLKKLEYLGVIIFTVFMLWILVSWADVLMHNSPSNPTDVSRYNAFVVLLGIK